MSSFVYLKIIFARAGLIKSNVVTPEVADAILCKSIDWPMSAEDFPSDKPNGPPNRVVKRGMLTVTREFDEASVRMLNAMKNRDLIKTARFSIMAPIVSPTGQKLMREQFVLQLNDAHVEDVDIKTTESGDSAVITETLKFNYSQIHCEYTKRASDLTLTQAKTKYSSPKRDVFGTS